MPEDWEMETGAGKGASPFIRIQIRIWHAFSVWQKLCVCTWLSCNGIQNCIRFWLYLSIQRAVHFPPFFRASFMTLVHLKPLLDVWGKKECCIHQNFGGREHHFLGSVLWAALFYPSWFCWSKAWLDHMCCSTGKKESEWQEKAQEVT